MEGESHNNYISLYEASRNCKYSQEYLSLRARQGNLRALKFGRNWVTTKQWLEQYLKGVNEYHNCVFRFQKSRARIIPKAIVSEAPENLPVEEVVEQDLPEKSLLPQFTPTPNVGETRVAPKLAKPAPIMVWGFDFFLPFLFRQCRLAFAPLLFLAAGVLIFTGAFFVKDSFASARDFIVDATQEISFDIEKTSLALASTVDVFQEYQQWLNSNVRYSASKIKNTFSTVAEKVLSTKEKLVRAATTTQQEFGKGLRGLSQDLRGLGKKISTNILEIKNFAISEGVRFQQGAKNIVSSFKFQVSRFGKFVISPWKILLPRIVVEDGISIEEIEGLKSEVEKLKSEPRIIQEVVKEVERVVEIERITKVEPVKEITKETIVTKVEEKALAVLRTQISEQIAGLESEVAKRLYAPGGVVSQTIYVTEPVSSPKIYQENGEIVLQTIGSGNVILSAATGLQLYGQQIIIDSTSILNPLIYLNDNTKITGSITAQNAIFNGDLSAVAANFSGDITGAGSLVISQNITAQNITATGDISFTGTSTFPMIVLAAQSSVPSASEGKVYFDDNDKQLKLYNSNEWVKLAADFRNAPFYCPDGYAPVPGDARYGTEGGFCVMKYEAKCASTSDLTTGLTSPATIYQTYNNSNTACAAANSKQVVSVASGWPITSISQITAKAYCESLGTNYHLITNDEWMTISRNAEQVSSNWSGGAVGSGVFARGWTASASFGDDWTNTVATSSANSCLYNTGLDTCGSSGTHLYRRTITLSNGEIIWDTSGNVWDWVDVTFHTFKNHTDASDGYSCPVDSSPATEWVEFADIADYGLMSYSAIRPSNSSWGTAQGLGQIFSMTGKASDNTYIHAIQRGGDFNDGAEQAGIFSIETWGAPSFSFADIGFRCAARFYNFTPLPAFATLNVDDGTLFVDSLTDRVGIGTTAPSYALDVVGSGKFSTSIGVEGLATTTGTLIDFAGVGDITTAASSVWKTTGGSSDLTIQSGRDLLATSTGAMIFATAGYERARLDTSGQLGIGTTNASTTLHIIDTTEQLRFGYAAQQYVSLVVADDGALLLLATGTDADIEFRTKSFDDAIVIDDSSQRVGVATSTPSAQFAVAGNIMGSGNIVLYGSATSTIEGPIELASHFRTTGNIYPSADAQYMLGAASYRWANIYTATTTIGGTIVIDTDDIRATGLLNITAAATSVWKTTGASSDLTIQSGRDLTVTSTRNIYLVASTGVIAATSSADIILALGDAGGANKFYIRDSSNIAQLTLDSGGNLELAGLATTTQLISTAPYGTAPFKVISTTTVANLSADLLDQWELTDIQKQIMSSATQPVNSKGNSFTTIQAAIDDQASSGWVYVPPGDYNEAVDIIGKNAITLFGQNSSSTRITCSDDYVLDIDNSDDVIIRDLRIEGADEHIIRLDDAQRCKIHNVYITDVIGGNLEAIDFQSAASADCEITNCRFIGAESGVISQYGYSPSLKIINNHFESCHYGIYIKDSTKCIIEHNTIKNAPLNGIILHDAHYSVITSNILLNSSWGNSNSKSAIWLDEGHHYIVSDNIIYDDHSGCGGAGCQKHGIYVRECDYSTINGNICKGSISDGIKVYGRSGYLADYNTLIGNVCEGNGGRGIYIFGDKGIGNNYANNNIVADNQLYNNTGANLDDDGTDTQISGNYTGAADEGLFHIGGVSSRSALTVTQSGGGYGAIIMGGNVGISTTTPRWTLDVAGNVGFGTTTDYNTPVLYVDSYINKVGIATSTPSAELAIVGNIIGSGNIVLYGSTTSTIAWGLQPAADADSRYFLGSPSYRWANIYAATTTIGGTIVIDTDDIRSTNSAINITTAASSVWKTTGGSSDLTIQSGRDLFATSTGNIYLVASTGSIQATSSDYITFATADTERMRILSGGNVGINTIDPQYDFHVTGKCVTADTLLPIVSARDNFQFSISLDARRRTPRRVAFQSISNDLIFKQVKDIQPGDYVLSLNEKTGTLVPEKILALMDMGVKPIYKLETEDGKTIRTTGNHPYLKGLSKKFAQSTNFSRTAYNTVVLVNHPDKVSIANQETLSSPLSVDKEKTMDGTGFEPVGSWVINQDRYHTPPIASLIYHDKFQDARWTKVVHLQEGDEIAVANDDLQSAKFSKIKKITILPPEQVYDLSIENTHNFVANGIIAHNTYISTSLSVQGLATTTGTLIDFAGAGNITAATASTWKTTSENLTITSEAGTLFATGTDIQLVSASGSIYATSSQDIILALGDAAGIKEFQVRDSSSAIQLAVNSNGELYYLEEYNLPKYDTSGATHKKCPAGYVMVPGMTTMAQTISAL